MRPETLFYYFWSSQTPNCRWFRILYLVLVPLIGLRLKTRETVLNLFFSGRLACFGKIINWCTFCAREDTHVILRCCTKLFKSFLLYSPILS